MRAHLEIFDRVSDSEGTDPQILNEHQRVRAVLFDGHIIEFAILDPITVEVRGAGHRATRLAIQPNASNSIHIGGVSGD